MWLLSKHLFLSCLIFIFSFTGIAQNNALSPQLKAKVDKVLFSVYQEEGLEINALTSTIEGLEGNFFTIINGDLLKGYIYVAQAPSMKNVFDYMVVFSPQLEIEKAKVLIYREQHGRQIGTVRWLSQFKGLSTEDRPELGKEIDGISGATISSKSMTKAVHDLLLALSNAKEKGLI